MASNDTTDPVSAEADQRAERAKASLRSRIAVIERRFGDVRERLDVPAQIRRHPWPAVGIAFALGALAGRGRSSRSGVIGGGGTTARSLGTTALAGVAALGLRIARELVLAQLGRSARQWLENAGAHDGDGSGDLERGELDERYAVPGRRPYAEP